MRKIRKKRTAPKHRKIIHTPAEKAIIALWSVFCAFLVGVFIFMTWFMYNPASRLAHNLKYGREYLAKANYSRAVTEFRRVLAQDEDNEEAYRGLMEVAIQSQDTEEAVELYERAADKLATYKEPLERLLEERAIERVEQKDYDGAFSVADTVEQVTGDKNEASLIRALVVDGMLEEARNSDTNTAMSIYGRLLTVENIDTAPVYELMAELMESEADPEAAVAVLEEGIDATGNEDLEKIRDQYAQDNADTFLPDVFIKELNDAMAGANFPAAMKVVQHDLFLYRIEEYATVTDELGEEQFDFSAIQPADMNTTIYAEHDPASGEVLLVIIDWTRTSQREAIFNELAYIPSTGKFYALSQTERVVSATNSLKDELHYYRYDGEEATEITHDAYVTELSEVFSEQFIEQAKQKSAAAKAAQENTGDGEEQTEPGTDGQSADENGDTGNTETEPGAGGTVEPDAGDGAQRTGGVM